VSVTFAIAVLVAFAYFFPVSTGMPPDGHRISRANVDAGPWVTPRVLTMFTAIFYPYRISVPRRYAASVLFLVLAIFTAALVYADDNLLLNGALRDGTGDTPDHWDSVNLGPRYAADRIFSWSHQPGSDGELRLALTKLGDAEWSQTVDLRPGWYHVSGEIQSKVDNRVTAAYIAVKAQGKTYSYPASECGSAWNPNDFYFRVGKGGQSVAVVCRLDGRGSAFFRHLRLIKMSEPIPPSAERIDIAATGVDAAMRQNGLAAEPYSTPVGNPWSVAVFMALLLGVAVAGWLTLGRTLA